MASTSVIFSFPYDAKDGRSFRPGDRASVPDWQAAQLVRDGIAAIAPKAKTEPHKAASKPSKPAAKPEPVTDDGKS